MYQWTTLPHLTKTGVILTGVGLFLFTWLFRFLALVGFPNDHFLYLAPAQQMLAGEWPSRDFVDPGTPLMYAVSALARLAVDSPLMAEALVVSTAFGLAAALTVYAGYLASGSLLIAVPVTIAQIAIFPRSYHYPKFLVFAAGVLAMWSYARESSVRRAAALAGCVVIAFLFRHDHGLYLGAAGVTAAALAGDGPRDRARRVVQVAGLVVLFALPYLAYVEVTTGLTAHVAAGIAYSRAEADRTMLGYPRFDASSLMSDENARVALYYVFYLLPALTIVLIGWGLLRRAPWARSDGPMLAPLAVLALVANAAFLRDPLAERLADPAVPACILSAWLIRRACGSRGWRRIVGCGAVVVGAGIAAVGVSVVGNPAEQIDRAGFTLSGDRFLERVRGQLTQLQAPLARGQFPSRVIEALVPFLEYAGRCTTPEQRLFVAGNAPEVYVFARRLFAGGQPMLRAGYFSTMADQRRVVLRLRQQKVPLALILTDSDAREFVLVMAELESEFRPVRDIPVEDSRILVRASRGIPPTGTDAATGFPCFT